jgi:hypothetical protein
VCESSGSSPRVDRDEAEDSRLIMRTEVRLKEDQEHFPFLVLTCGVDWSLPLLSIAAMK